MLRGCPSVGLWPDTRFHCRSADFDGSAHLARAANLAGIADAKSGILSAWVRFDGGDGAAQTILYGSNVGELDGMWAARDADGKVYVMDNTGSGASFLLVSSGTVLAGAGWRHLLAAWNGATGAKHLYIDGADALDAGSSAANNVDTEYTACTGWMAGNDAFSERLDGCLAELYFAPGQYLDVSDAQIRARFRTGGGRAVDLGPTGARPLGAAPLVYQSLRPGDAVAALATNRGTGGNFSVSGTLTFGSDAPSD